MKNKLLIAASLFSILLSGCGSSGDSSPAVVDNTNTWEDDTEYEETDTDYEEDIYEEPEEVVVATYPFTEIRPFSEGRAWVKFNKDGVICTGLIDTNGKLLYQAENQFFYISQFVDGCSYYSTKESVCGVIDIDGNKLFETQVSSDGGYEIIGYGNGHFLVREHIKNFDTDEWRYGTIDKNGNTLNEMKIDEDEFLHINNDWEREKIRYIGENFFLIDNYYWYNIEDSSCFKIHGGIIPDFYEGCNMIDYAADYCGYGVIIDCNFRGIQDGQNFEDAPGVVSAFEGNYIYSEGLALGDCNGYSEESAYGYYNKEGELVISLDSYRDKQIRGGDFCGGYAPITMKGADGEDYVSVIDKTGNLAYQPVKIDPKQYRTFSIYEPFESSSGYLQVTIEGEKKIIGPDGTIYTSGVDDLSMLDGLTFGYVSNGFMMMNPGDNDTITNPCYISLDTNTVIDSAKVVSTDTDLDDEAMCGDDVEDVSYIIPDSYDITGKWKSVGDSGFGQAQPGAIVVFDGNNCNFYSPKDTYAFYKEDDRYILDITSVLGESLSQTVNIIDNDNIEIAGASLRRIE